MVVLSLIGSRTVEAQSKYAVEFFGGMKYNGLGQLRSTDALNGVTAGLGASVYFGKSTELIGTTLFTYFPPSKPVVSGHTIIPSDAGQVENGQYSSEVLAGLRFHGQGGEFIHPYLVIQGGLMFLRTTIYQDAWIMLDNSTTQVMNIRGTEDIQMLGTINVGVGLQTLVTKSILLNFEVKYQILIGSNESVESFVPVVVSIQLPM